MTSTTTRLTAAVETYFAALHRVRASGGATGERSHYTALDNLLTAVGATLKPKVFCVPELADQGAGHPDFGLYAAKQIQRGQPKQGQTPERGVVEVKGVDDDAFLTAAGEQVSRYWTRYRLVLVTNTRDFVLVGEDVNGKPAKRETFRLADSAEEFARGLETPRAFARKVGAGLGEYLSRALAHRAALTEPKDVAWLLASYARDALHRVEAAGDAPSLNAVRSALEEALGIRFEGEDGARFFRSTLVQTLFYGVFSAWVLWARSGSSNGAPDVPPGNAGVPPASFNWRETIWYLRAPILQALFQQISAPNRLQPLGLVEVLDWTAAALDRVDRAAFFTRFDAGDAVPYFYEPFLEAFDPDLRKDLGVWYTPAEVVRYMVARVDKTLKADLGIADGLAADNVYVLDPCCGTGAYLAEVLRRIAANLQSKGLGALAGATVKQAATERVFGFEIMPAPFVVAHLQVGLTLQALDAPLTDAPASSSSFVPSPSGRGLELAPDWIRGRGCPAPADRPGIFLTNALTGWEPRTTKPLPFPELEEERDRAEQVKQATRILVILGNPPYNGFAGVAVDEERELSEAYRTTKRVRKPEGQGLNDLYVRFFRMADRRIAEKTGQGVVCFISNYSWLDGLSFTGMRERYVEAFDAVRIDCLNGDKYKTGKLAPDGTPDPSIFSTPGDPVGIQVGTAITTLVRKGNHAPAEDIGFRHLWGQAKREELLETAEAEPSVLYEWIKPVLPLGLPFAPTAVSEGWFEWPTLPELFPVSFPGVKTSRDGFLVDVDLARLKQRVAEYFNKALSHEEIARRYPSVMKTTARFDARAVRETLLARGGPEETGFMRFAYRPFDHRWVYWEAETKLLDEKRAEYRPHVFAGNLWLEAREREAKEDFSRGTFVRDLADNFGNGLSNFFPVWLRNDGEIETNSIDTRRPNLSAAVQRYLNRLNANVEDLFHHVLAVLHDPTYRTANAGALRMEWPRIPLPGWPDGNATAAAETLTQSAARGRILAQLLDPDTPVPGVTQGTLRPEIATIAVPATTDGRNMTDDDFASTAGWGHYGSGGAIMPGQGRLEQRPLTPDEQATFGGATGRSPLHSPTTFDVYLNDRAYWRNVPAAVWRYKLGGYQVLKKWLSYREQSILARPLTPAEVQHFTDTARRIAAILTLTDT